MTRTEETRTEEELEAVRRFKVLTEELLPRLAMQHHWPIRLDHCFKRICLDYAFLDVWYNHLQRPAERHLQGEPLERSVACAEAILQEGLPTLRRRDAESLKYRGKRPKRVGDGNGGSAGSCQL